MRKLFLIPAIALTLGCASAAAQTISPIARAMLEGYTELLKEDPKDYTTLYERGAQYFALSMYDNALSDIVKAIEYTPVKEQQMLVQEYSLLADICIELKQYPQALKAVEQALAINPDNYTNLYKKGNICLYLKQPQEAYRAFSSMQRLRSRSQEAYFGMAKANAMMGKTAEAEELMKEAEAADPSNYITYCRLGDLCMDLNDHDKAAVNYLAAFGLADDTSRPVASLYLLAERDYAPVANAIDYAISKTAKPTPLYFLKGNLGYAAGAYASAYDAFKSLLDMPDGRETSVYSQMARTCLALDRLAEADANVGIALSNDATADLLALRSNINLAQGNAPVAVENASKALRMDADNLEALIALAEALIATGEDKEALTYLNQAVMLDPSDTRALMLRAWVQKNRLKDDRAANNDYHRVATSPAAKPLAIMHKALAQSLSGKQMDAEATMKDALADNPTKEMLYYASIYYDSTGRPDQANAMRERAIAAGYQHELNLRTKSVPGVPAV